MPRGISGVSGSRGMSGVSGISGSQGTSNGGLYGYQGLGFSSQGSTLLGDFEPSSFLPTSGTIQKSYSVAFGSGNTPMGSNTRYATTQSYKLDKDFVMSNRGRNT